VRYWDANSSVYEINWSQRAGTSSSKTYRSTLKETLDVGLGFEASVNAFYVQASTSLQFDFNFHNGNSWENNTVSNEEIGSTKGIQIYKPPEGRNYQAYAFETAVYVTKQGTMRVAHAADPTGAPSGAAWWRDNYGQAPNPAVNLPNRFTFENYDWILTPGDARYQLRGLFLRKSELNPVTKSYDYLTGAVNAGVKPNVQVRVYNFSLHDTPVMFDTLVEYAEVDSVTDKVIGPKKPLGTVRTQLGPMGQADIEVPWDTTGLGGTRPGTARYYRFFVTVDPQNEVKNEIHEGRKNPRAELPPDSDNYGFWPWSSGVAVLTPPITRSPGLLAVRAGRLAVTRNGKPLAKTAKVPQFAELGLEATFAASRAEAHGPLVAFFDGDPEKGGRLVASSLMRGTVEGVNHAHARWRPDRSGTRRLVARVMGTASDPSGRKTSLERPLLVVPVPRARPRKG